MDSPGRDVRRRGYYGMRSSNRFSSHSRAHPSGCDQRADRCAGSCFGSPVALALPQAHGCP
jgi:hypothetical protein